MSSEVQHREADAHVEELRDSWSKVRAAGAGGGGRELYSRTGHTLAASSREAQPALSSPPWFSPFLRSVG